MEDTSMSEVRTYRAASMQEALAIVRKEIGADAVILHTRHVTRRRLIPFLKGRDQVEVTVGVGVNVRPHAKPSAAAPPAGADAVPDHPPTVSPGTPAVPSSPGTRRDTVIDAPPEPGPQTPRSAVSRAAELAAELERRNAEKARLARSLSHLEAAVPTEAPPAAADMATEAESAQAAASEPPDPDHSTNTAEPVPRHQAAALADAAQAIRRSGADPSLDVAARLDTLQRMMENLTRSSHCRGADEIPTELFDVYTSLIDSDIEDRLARELIFELRKDCSPDQLHDPNACRALLSARVESEIRVADPIRPANGRRRTVALVGPTGVGKTTTIAKLAANFRLRDGIRMGLVTVDTYRIAAVEQLRTYAEIIDLPMKVVTSPQEMRRALDELADLDLILIDTAGRSPRDELKIQELKQMLGEASIDEVHLVMSLTASVRSIRMTCEQFRPVNPTALVLTKLDEAAGMGSLVSVSREVSLPFSYLTTGQDVPEDIEPANASRIARLVLGQDRLFD